MRVSVAGLWHLGAVTAACCASGGHNVIAFDEDSSTIASFERSQLPIEEPSLAELVACGREAGRLRFTDNPADVADAEILWICYDTPVDENDVADTGFVHSRITFLVEYLKPGTLVLLSSQMPVGSTAKLEQSHPALSFAYSPENLRLGNAVEVFSKPDRVVIGLRGEAGRERLKSLFAPFTKNLEWMSVESAEMTKHALNAFLATSVAFINEVATLCERTGADAQEVERGLKTDVRIGRKAYLHPGDAFAGGTLARDIGFLLAIGKEQQIPTHLLRGVMKSNSEHKLWTRRRIAELLTDLRGKTVAVFGLTYKPGTNTLRRSASVELCRWLSQQGAMVRAFDPAIRDLPGDLGKAVHLTQSAEQALEGAHAVVVATLWPEFQRLSSAVFTQIMCDPVVLDPARHLENLLKDQPDVKYFAIGTSYGISG